MTDFNQNDLFGAELPAGFSYASAFITPAEERALMETIAALSLQEASYKQWTAKRRVVSYGGRYDFNENQLHPSQPMPTFLHPLRDKISAWTGTAAAEFDHAMIAEYRSGTQLGWHRDVPDYEVIAGVSLAGAARMRFRPYPPAHSARATHSIDLQPRSAYVMRDAARWDWQHAISPTRSLRYSITFRTLRRR